MQCSSFNFTLLKTDTGTEARRGVVKTPHGEIQTPFFMPVGTRGVVKTLTSHELEEIGAEIMLCNTYHLFLRPGADIVEEMGGLHGFASWQKPILTDSGGFQVFSLAKLNKIKKDGVEFRSHIDGSLFFFTPEVVMEIQGKLGADIVMAFDECIPYPAEREYCISSVKKTVEWALRSKQSLASNKQALFGIVQGGIYPDIREDCLHQLEEIGFDGMAIGGLSVGEPKEMMYDIVHKIAPMMDRWKPRYLMGVGMPDDIIESVSAGIDMFDCIIPTRQARNGALFTWNGRMIIKNAKFARDENPIDSGCSCFTCRTYSRAYLRHLYQSGETLSLRLNTIHNLHFYLELMKEIRSHIEMGSFSEFKQNMKGRWN
ncbi:MAG: tRNA guanosine(34) transglycosylase Tgt [Candidatus Schekmanbacteria bacterium]|nr:tRNA guanosine(34) transglycosylase Tgt [Candidatus Schekmanbacteria bacterium]